MKNGRNAAITAAVAFVLSAPLALGSFAAKADELSDLRANNELLQQRLDQLAQVGLQRPAVAPGTPSIAGSFPRSFLIPGTDTSIQIGGYVDLSASYYFQGGSNNSNAAVPPVNGAPVASGLPLPGSAAAARSRGWFRMQASESRLFVETRTPTAWGQALTHLEFDFFGCTAGGYCNDLNTATNPDTPRLRLAYGTLGGFMAGQNWVPGNDLQASPDIFDFGGDVGSWGWARAPQISYTTPPQWWMYGGTVQLAIVQPYTQIATPVGGITDESNVTPVGDVNTTLIPNGANLGKTPAPDVALVLNWQQPWGHFQLHGALHPMQLDDGIAINRSYMGYGGGFSGNVHPGWFGWTKDNIGFGAYAGDGLGHWNNPPGAGATTLFQAIATNYGGTGFYGHAGVPTTSATAASILATTVFSWGGEVNYLHWWTPTLRSSFTWGIGHQDVPIAVLGFNPAYNKEIQTAHANLVWSPVAFIDTGFEFIWDHRKTALNVTAQNGYILDYDFKVKF